MAPRYADQDGVWALLPFDMKRPGAVSMDGNGGVTESTYGRLVDSVETEVSVRLDQAGVPISKRGHKLVIDAVNLLVAAQVCRKVKSFQDQASSFFAEANVKLRLFFEAVVGYSEGQSGGEVVLGIAEALNDSDLADSGLGLSVFSSIKI